MWESGSSKRAANRQRQPVLCGQLRVCLTPTTGRTSGVGSVTSIQGQLEDFTSYIQGLAERAPDAMVPHKSLDTESQRLGKALVGF